MSTRIRPAAAADVAGIMAIERGSFALPWREETFASLIDRVDADVLVAERHGQVVGYVVLWTTVDEAELANIAVAAKSQGAGVGTGLLSEILDTAAQRGAKRVFLDVRWSNTGAVRLYERFGFKEVGVRKHYYRHPVEDARVLVVDLAN